MSRVSGIVLNITGGVAKGGFRFRSGWLQQRFKLTFFRHNHPTAPAAARSGLDEYRITDLAGDLPGVVYIGNRAVRAGHRWQAARPSSTLRLNLVAHDADMFRLGSNEGDVMRFYDFSELRIFRSKTIARVDCVRSEEIRVGKECGSTCMHRWSSP